jgi:hypothetical protein
MPIGEYVLVNTGGSFKIWICAGGGYSVLRVNIDGQEQKLDEEQEIFGYTIPSLSSREYVVRVQFSVFSDSRIKTVAVANATDDTVNYKPLLYLALAVGGIIAVIVLLKDKSSKEVFTKMRNDEADKNAQIDAEVDKIVMELSKREREIPRSGLDAEIEKIMKELEQKGGGDDEY